MIRIVLGQGLGIKGFPYPQVVALPIEETCLPIYDKDTTCPKRWRRVSRRLRCQKKHSPNF